MTIEILNWLKEVRTKYLPEKGKALDVGAMDMNGSARQFFDGWDYWGVDMMPGKGVDEVVNGHDLMKSSMVYLKSPFDVTLCLETFEHDDKFWLTLENIRMLTKHGGHMIITTPTFKFPIHRHPKDYYRFGEDIYRDFFFKDFEILDLREVVSKGVNPGIVCIGKKL